MKKKAIALGNILMKDDGVAIHLMKLIEGELLKNNVGVIYGEIYTNYILPQINEGDFLYIIDAYHFEGIEDRVIFKNLETLEKQQKLQKLKKLKKLKKLQKQQKLKKLQNLEKSETLEGRISREEFKEEVFRRDCHSFSIIEELKLQNIKVKGYFIGIRAEEIDFGTELSFSLQKQIPYIKEEILEFIKVTQPTNYLKIFHRKHHL